MAAAHAGGLFLAFEAPPPRRKFCPAEHFFGLQFRRFSAPIQPVFASGNFQHQVSQFQQGVGKGNGNIVTLPNYKTPPAFFGPIIIYILYII
jgi:hypothetical protein